MSAAKPGLLCARPYSSRSRRAMRIMWGGRVASSASPNISRNAPWTSDSMPTVSFTRALERFLEASAAEVDGVTVGEALAAVFASRPALRGYVLDDQGALR